MVNVLTNLLIIFGIGYGVLGFAEVRRAESDDVAIIRNEHGVESISCSTPMPAIRPPTS